MKRFYSLLFACFLSSHALADELAASFSGGTTGLGVHASMPLDTYLHLRLGVNYLRFSTVVQNADGDTQATISLNTWDSLLDWYPDNSIFHVTGGLVYNLNHINTVTPLKGVTYLGTTYSLPPGTTLGHVNGTFNVGNIFSPYLGIGWGNPLMHKEGWNITSDLGLLFHGKPRINLESEGCTAGPACIALASQVANEEAKLNDEYAGKIFYPVARVGLSYIF